jgi:hypothetical protein
MTFTFCADGAVPLSPSSGNAGSTGAAMVTVVGGSFAGARSVHGAFLSARSSSFLFFVSLLSFFL